jgi:hypothetical protein
LVVGHQRPHRSRPRDHGRHGPAAPSERGRGAPNAGRV